VTFEQTTGYPLEDSHTNLAHKIAYFLFVIILLRGFCNSFVVEHAERLERVLVHRINNVHLDQQEIQHGSFSGNWSVDFTGFSNNLFSNFSFSLGDFNFS
jgi:hypothetical protein